jgi:hypothetical protein
VLHWQINVALVFASTVLMMTWQIFNFFTINLLPEAAPLRHNYWRFLTLVVCTTSFAFIATITFVIVCIHKKVISSS